MPFEAILIKTLEVNHFLLLNCTRVRGQYWIYEGFDELLDDNLTKYTSVEGIVPSLGGFTRSELVEGCLNWFGIDIDKDTKADITEFKTDKGK